MKNVLVDTGFWFALYDEDDEHHAKAESIIQNLVNVKFLIPFPTLYETINTKFSKNENFSTFRAHISKETCEFVHDSDYKEIALENTFESSISRRRPLSLVDMIIRLMMEDPSLKIDGLISFNPGDFIDVCIKRHIQLISDSY